MILRPNGYEKIILVISCLFLNRYICIDFFSVLLFICKPCLSNVFCTVSSSTSPKLWLQSNGQIHGQQFDLEKSDKIVLPPSALNALTDCNAPFPVLLKIQMIDPLSNKPLASNMFSYVVDYSAPEGLICMFCQTIIY